MEEEMRFRNVFLVCLVVMVASCTTVVEKPVVQTVVVEKEVVVEKPVTVVVAKETTPAYPPIELRPVNLVEGGTLILSWLWSCKGLESLCVSFRVWIWEEGQHLSSEPSTTCNFYYRFSYDQWPSRPLQPGEEIRWKEIRWKVDAWRDGVVLAESPVGTFALPGVVTPTPTSTPQTVVVEKEVLVTVIVEVEKEVVVERRVVETSTPTGFIKIELLNPNGSPWSGDPDPLELWIHRGDEPVEQLGVYETYTGPAGEVKVEVWGGDPEEGFWLRYSINRNHVAVDVEARKTAVVSFVLSKIETGPTPRPTREPTPTPVLPRPSTPTPTPR